MSQTPALHPALSSAFAPHSKVLMPLACASVRVKSFFGLSASRHFVKKVAPVNAQQSAPSAAFYASVFTASYSAITARNS